MSKLRPVFEMAKDIRSLSGKWDQEDQQWDGTDLAEKLGRQLAEAGAIFVVDRQATVNACKAAIRNRILNIITHKDNERMCATLQAILKEEATDGDEA